MASEALVTLTEDNFETEVTGSSVPVIVDFWAEWCGPCRMLTPILEELATEKGAAVKIGKVNVDENPNLSQKFNVRSIPMLVFFKDGQAKETVVGVQSKGALAAKLDAAVANPDESMAMAQRWHAHGQHILSMECILEYIEALLRAYAALQRFEPLPRSSWGTHYLNSTTRYFLEASPPDLDTCRNYF